MKSFAFFLLLIFDSYLISYVLYQSFHVDNIFAVFIYAFLGMIWLFLFYAMFVIDLKVYKENHRLIGFLKTAASLASLIPLIFIYRFYQSKISVPNLMEAHRHGVYADFKIDGTYFIRSGSWGSKKHLYGTYTLRDSIIKLDKSNLSDVLTSNTLVIRQSDLEFEKKRPDYDRIESKRYLVQLDKNGREIIARCIDRECMPYKFEIVDSVK